MSKTCKSCNLRSVTAKCGIQCRGECQRWYHKKCLSEKPALTAIAAWQCPSCEPQQPSASPSLSLQASPPAPPLIVAETERSNTPAEVHEDKDKKISRKSGLFQVPVDYANALSVLQRSVIDGQQQVMESLEFMTGRLDDMEKRFSSFQEALREVAELKREREQLRTQVSELAERDDELEQRSRDRNVEIRGVPPAAGENLLDVIRAIAEVTQCPVEAAADVEECRRVRAAVAPDGTSRAHPNIVVRFRSKAVRDGFLCAARKRRPLTTHTLRLSGSATSTASPVYVNEHLTVHRKKMLSRCREVARERGYRFVWVQAGHILARKEERSRVINVNNERDISKL